MSTVYVVNQAAKWREGKLVPFNLKPAEQYGRLKVVFSDRPPPLHEAMPTLVKAFAEFTAADYLLIAGDMDLVVWASVLALQATGGKLVLLKWDGRQRQYLPVHSPTEFLRDRS